MSTSGYRTQAMPQAQHIMLTTPRSNRSISYMPPYGFCTPGQPQSTIGHVEPGSSSGVAGGIPGSVPVGSSRSVNPFLPNPHGHPSFNPIRVGSKGTGDGKTPKQPKPPDKPLMPYMRYSRKVWDSVKASNPDLKLWEIGKIIGQMWRELSDAEKQEYLDEYEAEKIQYTDAMKAYHNSPAYQSWIAAKGKVDVDAESEEPEKTRRTTKTPAASREPVEPRIVTIQPADEDDDADDGFSVKHVASARFQRNHLLINDIFSDAVVPDVRTVINESRMTVLKRQVHSLTMHQKKLESELLQIEEKHRAKKCKFAENSEKFYEDLARLCEERPQISEEQFVSMVTKAKDDLRERHKQLQQQQQQQPVSVPPVPPPAAESADPVQQPPTPLVPPPVTETSPSPQLLADKKSDEQIANELEAQSSQQLCVLDKAASQPTSQLDAAAEFESEGRDMDTSKENLNDSDSDGGSDDTQPADDDFTSTFTSVADDPIEMMDCSVRGDNDEEVTDKPTVVEPVIDNVHTPAVPVVAPPTIVPVPSIDDQAVCEPILLPATDSSIVVKETSPDVDQCKDKDDSDVTSSASPPPPQLDDPHNEKALELPSAAPDVAPAEEVEQKAINGEQSVHDTSLLSHLSDDVTDDSTDETRGESACETSVAE